MNSLEAAEQILSDTGDPLHYQEITKLILEQGLWHTEGKTPDATINAQLAMDIKKHRDLSRFIRTEPGVYGLREWGMEEHQPTNKKSLSGTPARNQKISFTDAAELILDATDEKRPLHYRDIMDRILELDLVETSGLTPEATLYSMILTEIKRQVTRGEKPRFVKYGQGMVGLRKWMGEGVAYQIEQQNREVQEKLLEHLISLTAEEFEFLTGRLLAELGFEDIEVTSHGGDRGIDIRGTLVVGDVIKTKIAVQAKKWQNNIQSPVIQQVRGSLGTHEQGLIITTSGFSKGAIEEAERPNAVPVALVDGEQLIELLIEHQILVHRVEYELISLDLE